jgi:hypothetical protein
MKYCCIPDNEYPNRFLGKIAEPADCMKDACYWTYPVEQMDAIKANPKLMDDPEFNAKYACRLTEAQWFFRSTKGDNNE